MNLPTFPGTDFDTVIDANLKGAAVRPALLAYFDLRDAPIALWGGEFDATFGGIVWQGLGRSGVLIQVDGLDDSADLSASQMNFTLSGVDTTILSAFKSEDRAAYVGCMVGVYLQFLDVDWQALCPPFAVRAGILGPMAASRAQGQVGAQRSIVVPATNIFYGRGVPSASYFTDRDQKERYSGDRFFEFVAELQDTSFPMPWR